MVNLTIILRSSDKSFELIRKHLQGKFIDTIRLNVKGGSGGSGFPKYGGVGGNGGSVYVEAVESMTLKDVCKKYKDKKVTACKGQDSAKRCILGMKGSDAVIQAPVGISIYNEKKILMGELNEEGSRILVAKGGIGGRPETGFGGMKGENQAVTIDLKLIADVGFVGFPNAGKSTLLAALSRARPKIASYPFTTIRPNIGVMSFKDNRKISLADLPGLIEGAHCNIGMGHRFLRHVERTKLLLLIVDVHGFQLNPKHVPRSFLDTIVLLNKELELYRKDLLEKPAILIVNKMDSPGATNILRECERHIYNLSDYIKDCPEEMRPEQVIDFDGVIPFSAKHCSFKDLKHLKYKIREIIDENYGNTSVEEEITLFKSLEDSMKEKAEVVV